MDSFINEIVFDALLTNEQKLELIKKQCEISKFIKSKINEGDFESNYFDKDREAIYKECESSYDSIVWRKLDKESQTDLKNAYFYAAFNKKIGDDESTPIWKLTKTVENEIRNKLFIRYAELYSDVRLEIGDNNDITFDKALSLFANGNNLAITLGQMLFLIKESFYYKKTKSNYAFELRLFLENSDWNLDVLYSRNDIKFYIDYPLKYRNDSAHNRVYDERITEKCKKETRDILTWFLNSYKATL